MSSSVPTATTDRYFEDWQPPALTRDSLNPTLDTLRRRATEVHLSPPGPVTQKNTSTLRSRTSGTEAVSTWAATELAEKIIHTYRTWDRAAWDRSAYQRLKDVRGSEPGIEMSRNPHPEDPSEWYTKLDRAIADTIASLGTWAEDKLQGETPGDSNNHPVPPKYTKILAALRRTVAETSDGGGATTGKQTVWTRQTSALLASARVSEAYVTLFDKEPTDSEAMQPLEQAKGELVKLGFDSTLEDERVSNMFSDFDQAVQLVLKSLEEEAGERYASQSAVQTGPKSIARGDV